MKINRLLIFLFLIIFSITVSCKKDEENKANPLNSFSGSLSFSVPDFVEPAEQYTITPRGLSKDGKGGFGYKWSGEHLFKSEEQISRKEEDDLSNNGAIVIQIPDTIGFFRLTCTAFASGYYNTSYSKNFIIVKQGKSLDYGKMSDNIQTFVDSRDNHQYRYVRIGNKYWMIDNLAYKGYGKAFYDCEAMNFIYGRFYNWQDANKACPQGWRIPSEKDWKDLAMSLGVKEHDNVYKIAGDLMVNAKFHGKTMWSFEPSVRITNKAEFYAIPVGYAYYNESGLVFKGNFSYATFWTSDIDPENPNLVLYRYIHESNPNLILGSASKTDFLSCVRCVKDI